MSLALSSVVGRLGQDSPTLGANEGRLVVGTKRPSLKARRHSRRGKREMWRLPLRSHRRFGVRGPISRGLMTQRREMARSLVVSCYVRSALLRTRDDWDAPPSPWRDGRGTPMGGRATGVRRRPTTDARSVFPHRSPCQPCDLAPRKFPVPQPDIDPSIARFSHQREESKANVAPANAKLRFDRTLWGMGGG